MSQAAYESCLARLGSPQLTALLPSQWPQRAPSVDRRSTVAAVRRAAATHNLGLMLLGYGDGTACELVGEDPVCRDKQLHVLVMPEEIEAFAHDLGTERAYRVLRHPRIMLQVFKTLEDAKRLLTGSFAEHGDIARLAGTTLVSDHPLEPAAARQREAWMPDLRRVLAERFDCLGNDVYDTFMGAKHALLQGRGLAARRRSSALAGRFAGAGAICLASGPSGAEHLARVREIQHEHVVIVADSFLGGALAAGIEPDFVCMVERTDDMHRLIDEHAGRCRATMVALPLVHPSSVAPFGERVVWWWNSDDLYPWLNPREPRLHSGRSAGTHTVALAAHLGCAKAWLVGHDLAFRDGRSHAAGTAAFAVDSQAAFNKGLSRTSSNYYASLLDVPRNGGGTVETTGVWNIFRGDIEAMVGAFSPRCQFINVNRDCGAVIHGCAEGELPMAGGARLDKALPEAAFDSTYWDELQPRARKLPLDLDAIEAAASALGARLNDAKPLALSNVEIEVIARELDLKRMVSSENAPFFTYVLRAAHRNLMLRLHHNTHVRTIAERDWNQIQVMRMYLGTLPALAQRLRAELASAVEGFA